VVPDVAVEPRSAWRFVNMHQMTADGLLVSFARFAEVTGMEIETDLLGNNSRIEAQGCKAQIAEVGTVEAAVAELALELDSSTPEVELGFVEIAAGPAGRSSDL